LSEICNSKSTDEPAEYVKAPFESSVPAQTGSAGVLT